jgi:hypothetical protein
MKPKSQLESATSAITVRVCRPTATRAWRLPSFGPPDDRPPSGSEARGHALWKSALLPLSRHPEAECLEGGQHIGVLAADLLGHLLVGLGPLEDGPVLDVVPEPR